ncbi:MAG: BCCT family transporter [Atopobiaceae bacterium]|nr:BCCT family transporter [Atopobiaceae bacterium]
MNKDEFKNPVFLCALALCGVIAVWAIAFNPSFSAVSNAIFGFLTVNFGWLYLLAMLSFVIFCVILAFSKFGDIRLGPDDSRPEYSTVTWFAMLFACGMGVGLVFWGIAEPLSHYASPSAGVEPMSPESAKFAMGASVLHWGIHPWANYAIIGLCLSYFMFRKGKTALISSSLYPIIGEKNSKGILGTIIDVLAVFATMAGVVTSLGLGVLQINAGLNYLFGIPNNLIVQIVILVAVSCVFITSATVGIDKGIARLSDFNLIVAVVVLVLCFLVGPKVDALNNLVCGLGEYINNFCAASLAMTGYGDNSWMLGWRIFYWAWWIAWAPFVGVFIARISKGRTIREFIAGVVLVPAIASLLWFSVFGTLGLTLANSGAIDAETVAAVAGSPETGLFVVLNMYPFGRILSIVITILLATFFVTSADSGTFVMGMLSSNGNMNPPAAKKILWGVVQVVMAIGLLMAGGLKPLQTISIAAAFPFIFIMIACMASLVVGLIHDHDTPNVGDPDFVPESE